MTEEGMIWLGDLAGFEMDATDSGNLLLNHRCGWSIPIESDGITGDGAAFLANIVVKAIEQRVSHDCRKEMQKNA